jgi:3-oxoacyl-[acyl-carrier protein] reductase
LSEEPRAEEKASQATPPAALLHAPELAGRVALVTGGGRGIGRACSVALAASGVKVVVNYAANAEAAGATVEQIIRDGGEAVALQSDIGTREGAEAAVAEATRAFGGLHILVNNAGILRDNLILRMDLQDWESVLRVNLTGAFLTSKLAIRGMLRQRWGRIVNMASVAGVVGNAGQANYSAAKAGLIGLTRALAREVGSRQITVNAIAPGFIRTDMTQALPAGVLDQVPAMVALGRVGIPEDVSGAVLFLCSDAASYITGEVIRVDGGLSL